MKGKGKGAIVLSGLFVAVFACVVIVASGYPKAARLAPLAAGGAGLLLAVIQFAKDLFELFRSSPEAGEPEAAEEKPWKGKGGKGEGMATWQIVATLLVCFGGILAFGFWYASPVFLVGFLRYVAKQRWTVAVVSSGVFTAALYALFELGLKIMMFRGFLFGASFS